jgi:hypothetical protein
MMTSAGSSLAKSSDVPDVLNLPARPRLNLGRLGVVVSFSALYFPAAIVSASRKPLWYDELFTFYIAQLPTLHDLWRALLEATDPAPPGNYLLTRAAMMVFGNGPVAVRLPQIVGLWVMCVCVFLFVSRRCALPYAAATLALTMSRTVYGYAVEARPYGVVLGCVGVALLSWQFASEKRYRVPSLIAFTASLSLAFACHYFSVVLLVVFGLAEIGRFVWERRIDRALVACLVVSALSLLPYIPLVQAHSIYSKNYWSHPTPALGFGLFSSIFDPPQICALLALLAVLVWRGRSLRSGPIGQLFPDVPTPEKVLIVALAAYPVFAFALGVAVRGFVPRYGLPGAVGAAVLVGHAVARCEMNRLRSGIVTAAILSITPGLMLAEGAYDFARGASGLLWRVPSGLPTQGDLPIVVASTVDYIQLFHYAPAALKQRLVYVVGNSQGTDDNPTTGNDIVKLARRVPLTLMSYSDMKAAHRSFLLYQTRAGQSQIAHQLDNDGATLVLKTEEAGQLVYQVTFPDPSR